MITPNLASRPFLNTRPVWIVAGAAAILTLVFVALNIWLYLATSSHMEAELARRDELEARHEALATEVRADVDDLQKVPWRALTGKVVATNVILREHSFSWLEMLDDIERVMPWNVRMTTIAPNVKPEEVTLSLEIVAQTRGVRRRSDCAQDAREPLLEVTEDTPVKNPKLLFDFGHPAAVRFGRLA
ncbi:MAG: hypothetical protein P8Y93_06165, partial [Acidobacteriota bacterium]